MSNEESESAENVLTQFRLGDRFSSRGVFASAYSSETYLAVEQGSSDEVILQVARSMIGSDMRRVNEFTTRIQKLKRFGTVTPEVLQLGVDGGGAGFVVMRKPLGAVLGEWSSTEITGENIFTQIIKLAAQCHSHEIILGDVGFESFYVRNDGHVFLLSLCGIDPYSVKHFVNRPSQQTTLCFSPEQLRTDRSDKASDVFALGVLGYHLLTGADVPRNLADPTKEADLLSILAAPSSYGPHIPLWADFVIGKSLIAKRSDRFPDASAMAQAIDEANQTGTPQYLTTAWGSKALVVRPGARGSSSTKSGDSSGKTGTSEKNQLSTRVSGGAAAVRVPETPRSSNFSVYIALALLLIVSGIFGVRALMSGSGAVVSSGDPLTAHAEVAPADLKESILSIQSRNKNLVDRKAALSRVGAHPDPIGYAVLVTVSRGDIPGEGAAELQTEAEKLLVDRLDSLNEPVTSKAVARWFETVHRGGGSPSQSAVFGDLLRAADTSRGVAGRTSLLRGAYSVEPSLTREIAASLALDNPQETEFTNLVREFLGASGVKADRERSIFALIAVDKLLSFVFVDALQVEIPKLSDDDLRWVLEKLPSVDNALVFRLADEILKRHIIEPIRGVFLDGLVAGEKFNIPRPVRAALVRGSLGEVSEKDYRELSVWASPAVERVMLGICVEAADPQVRSSALEFLLNRSVSEPVAKRILRWSREELGDRRTAVAHAIGVLSLADIATIDDVKQAFDELMAQSVGSALFTAAIETKNPMLITEALARLGAVVPPPEIAQLLSDEHKEVRIAAIQALRGQNNVTVLQAIYRGYEHETDPEVKALYEAEHWVTRDRKNSESGEGAIP